MWIFVSEQRGFTGQEELADLGLVRLNGRIGVCPPAGEAGPGEPLIGRMMNADCRRQSAVGRYSNARLRLRRGRHPHPVCWRNQTSPLQGEVKRLHDGVAIFAAARTPP